jgi:lambda family phage portal protein
MKLLDRTIEMFAPQWAVSRMRARVTLDVARSYTAARRGRSSENWLASGSSANAEIGPAAALIRARARDLVRNNVWARSAQSKFTAHLTGTGIVPRLITGQDEPERRQMAMSDWDAFSDHCSPDGQLDFYGLQAQIANALFESGEALVRFLPRPTSWGLRVPLQIEVLEPDYIDSSKNLGLDNGGWIIQGIEFDRFGRRVAYWLYDEHPGDMTTVMRKASYQSRRVPATEVLHIFRPLRPHQARGVPILTPAVARFRDIEDYAEAERVRKKIAACFAAFIEVAGESSPLTDTTTKNAAGRDQVTLAPGMIQRLQMGEKVTFGNPPAAEGYLDYMSTELHAIAAGADMTYEMMTGDLSGVNFSSIRVGRNDFWAVIDQYQWLALIPQFCRPVWRKFAAVQAIAGRRDANKPYDANWTPPARAWLDPATDVKAERDAMRAGLLPPQEAVARRGEHFDDVVDQYAAAINRFDELGLVFDSDARKTSAAGLTQARPEGTKIPAAGAPAED